MALEAVRSKTALAGARASELDCVQRAGSVYLGFADFAETDAAAQTYMPTLLTGSTVAPQVPSRLQHAILYRGTAPDFQAEHNLSPYRLGLLTQQ